MRKSYKALVASTERHARLYGLDFLELDPDEWVFLSPGSALMGRRFSKVVFIGFYGDKGSPLLSGHFREWVDHLTKVKMLPEDQKNVHWID